MIMIIADVASTGQGAYRLLRTRVAKINKIHKNYIICPMDEHVDKIRSLGIEVVTCPMRRDFVPLLILEEIWEMKRAIRTINPDIVHSHNSKTGAIARLAVASLNRERGRTHKIRMIHQVHGYHHTLFSGMKRKFYRWIEIFLTRYTDVLLFQNRFEYALAQGDKKNKKCRLSYIGNGINLEEVTALYQNFPMKAPDLITCVARIEPVKNHEMLIYIAKAMVEMGFIGFRFELIGEGDTRRLENLMETYGLRAYFTFCGELDREAVLFNLAKSRLAILTSKKEGLPRAIVEALVLKTPCIGTNVVGTNEVIEQGKNGYLIELDDAEQGAAYIIELLTKDSVWQTMSTYAYTNAIQQYNEDGVIEKLLETYASFNH